MPPVSLKPIKVVRIFSRLNIGGPSIHVTLLSEGLQSPYSTILVTGKVGDEEGDMSYLLKDDLSYRHLYIKELGRELHFWSDVVAFWKIFRLLRSEKPDILHTHTSKAGLLGRLAGFLARVPIRIHTFHGHLFHNYYSGLKSHLIRWVERALGWITTHTIAISPTQKRDLVERYRIVSSRRTSVVPLGFDLSQFKEQTESAEQVRQKFGLPVSKFVVTIVGRLVPIKNHALFLKVALQVLKDRQDVHFVIAGDGPSLGDLTSQVQGMGLKEHVTFLGWQKECAPIYHLSDIICLTSLNEGTPVSLIEAQAAATPVITTAVGGVEDIVFPGENGYVLSLDDVEGFAAKILYLLDRPELRRKMAEYGRAFVLDKYDKKRLFTDIDQLYARLLKMHSNVIPNEVRDPSLRSGHFVRDDNYCQLLKLKERFV